MRVQRVVVEHHAAGDRDADPETQLGGEVIPRMRSLMSSRVIYIQRWQAKKEGEGAVFAKIFVLGDLATELADRHKAARFFSRGIRFVASFLHSVVNTFSRAFTQNHK